MDSLQPVLQPIQRIWTGLTRGQRLGLGIVAAALLGLLFIVSTVGHGADTAVAFSGLSTDDMAAIVTKLKDAKIPYELGDGGVIRVPSGQVQDARLATAGMGLSGKPATGSGFELFNQPSFGQTEFTQKVNYQRALENEIARSIDQMDAVDTSRVHLVMPAQSLFATQQQPTTASVMLKLKPGKRLDSAQASSISNLVASSVEGLKPQNLIIVDVNGRTLTPDNGSDLTGLSSKQLEAQRSYETTTERNLQAMLDRVLGTGKANVRVSALMNWDQTEQTNETFTPSDPTQTPVRTSHDITEITNAGANAAAAGGVPGAASNNGAVPTYQGGTGTTGGTSKTDNQTTYELNKTVQKIVRAPGSVTRLSVSVVLDDDPNNPNAGLRQSVQDAVNAAAGIDPTRGDVLTVTSLAFDQTELLATQAAMADATQKEQLMNYLHLAALGLGPVLMLLVLFLIFRRGRKKTTAAQVIIDQATAMPAPIEIPDPAAPRAPSRPPKPNAQPIVEDPQKVYIRDQIQLLGKSNPATVAQLIQTWMDEDRRN
jgi:flagellar M-ring protein FliF